MANLNISVSHLPSIVHNSIPVITTDLLADVYETDIKNIHMNFARNNGRFVSGKHFFKLEGSELKQFKNKPTNCGSVAKQARSLVLWTERGAARHAKMLDTDRAWDVFEILEDNYFTKYKDVAQFVKVLPTNASTEDLIALRDILQKVIHEGEFIPAGHTAPEYSFPKTRKPRSKILEDFIHNPKNDTLHQLLAWMKKDGHNVEEAERVLHWVRDYMHDVSKKVEAIRTHAQYIEFAVNKL